MKKILFAVLLTSTTVFADKADLRLFNTLLSSGVQAEAGMSQYRFAITDVDCARHNQSKVTVCDFQQDGKKIRISGKKASVLFTALFDKNPGSIEGAMGTTHVDTTRLTCDQVSKGVTDDVDQSAAARTVCDVEETCIGNCKAG